MIAHQESMSASVVLKAQTKKNGLLGPSQLTSEKLKILINTPTISIARIFRVTRAFSQRRSFTLVSPLQMSCKADPVINTPDEL